MVLTVQRNEPTGVWTVDLSAQRSETDAAAELATAFATIADAGGGTTELWVHDIDDAVDAVVIEAGFVAYRDLWQLRCPLPAEPSSIETRAFVESDTVELVGVNNRAFSWHPEQSGMTSDSLAATMTESWYDADGFRIYQPQDEILGFCWTKVHADETPVLGEIYVIAVDPSAHGQGLGSPMTRAGLDWLAAQGIEHAMLYVESDNDAANRTYARIGFVHHRTDRAYNRTIEASTT